jgi:SAM-dependent methyltransferase
MADGRFSVASGDARHLAEDDGSYDAVLLLGPLYHPTDRTDRVGALAEARHVTRPGGIVAAAVISRYASTFDGFFRGFIDTPGFTALMTDDLKTGQHRNPGSDPGVLHHRLLPRQSGHRQRNNRLRAPAGPAAHRGPAALGTRHPGPAQRPRPAAAHPRQKGAGRRPS